MPGVRFRYAFSKENETSSLDLRDLRDLREWVRVLVFSLYMLRGIQLRKVNEPFSIFWKIMYQKHAPAIIHNIRFCAGTVCVHIEKNNLMEKKINCGKGQ